MNKKQLDKAFKTFTDEIIKYIESHPEYENMLNYYMHDNRVKGVKWGMDAFEYWQHNKLEWFMNHSLIEYEKQSL